MQIYHTCFRIISPPVSATFTTEPSIKNRCSYLGNPECNFHSFRTSPPCTPMSRFQSIRDEVGSDAVVRKKSGLYGYPTLVYAWNPITVCPYTQTRHTCLHHCVRAMMCSRFPTFRGHPSLNFYMRRLSSKIDKYVAFQTWPICQVDAEDR